MSPTRSNLKSALYISIVITFFVTGCATAPGRTASTDPWQGFNRGIYKVNDSLDKAAIKPIAKTYRYITPQFMRTGISNFFSNLGTPWTMVNQLLQAKPKLMAQDTCRFVINTVVGLGGFIDVADKINLERHDEDFGQTLSIWGVPSGPYLVLPLLGPSTLRDTVGRVPDYLSRPTRNVELPWEADTTLTSLEIIQKRESLLHLDDTLSKAYDPYGLVRDSWLQRREFVVYDGNPPINEPEELNSED